MIILPAPVRPDLDCIGGAIAYAALLNSQGQTAKVWIGGVPDGEAQFYLDLFPNFDFASEAEARAAVAYVLVDFSEASFMPAWFDRTRVTEVIDHRFFNQPETEFPNATIELATVGAAATLVAERLMRADFTPSPAVATMLYGAIYSNTLCLKGELTTVRDRDAAVWLLQAHPSADAHIAGQLQARSAELLDSMPQSLLTEMKMVKSRFGTYGFSQFELPGAGSFWQTHQEKIRRFLTGLPHPVVFNLIDLDAVTSRVYCTDDAYRVTLDHQYKRDGDTHIAEPARMRKEIGLLFC